MASCTLRKAELHRRIPAADFSASDLKAQNNDRFETDDPAAPSAFRQAFDVAWGS